jgi:hypothetical protein
LLREEAPRRTNAIEPCVRLSLGERNHAAPTFKVNRAICSCAPAKSTDEKKPPGLTPGGSMLRATTTRRLLAGRMRLLLRLGGRGFRRAELECFFGRTNV